MGQFFKTDKKSCSCFSQDLETFRILHKRREEVPKMGQNICFCNFFTKVEIIPFSYVFQMIQSIPNLGQITISQYDCFWLDVLWIFRNLAILWTRHGHNYISLLCYFVTRCELKLCQSFNGRNYTIQLFSRLCNYYTWWSYKCCPICTFVDYEYSFLRICTLLDLMVSKRAL